METDCLFCRITLKEIPAEIIFENKHTFAFLDIRPNNAGHTLVVPKIHYRNILDMPESVWLEVMKTVHMLAPVIKNAVGAGGINLGMNNEPAAHQLVFHAHMHIIPRIEGDPHKPWIGTEYKEGEAKTVAEKIRNTLG